MAKRPALPEPDSKHQHQHQQAIVPAPRPLPTTPTAPTPTDMSHVWDPSPEKEATPEIREDGAHTHPSPPHLTDAPELEAPARPHTSAVKRPSPVVQLPPYRVEMVYTTQAETIDWGLQLLGVPSRWKITKGAGAKVAILDTGVAPNHTDLRDAVKKARSFVTSRSGTADVAGHGSHCAGIVAARENSSGVIGVAPQADLYIGKVLGDNGAGTIAGIVAGIRWAISMKVDIISMSLGSSEPDADLEAAINEALRANILVIAAAGNEGPDPDTVGYPAHYEGVISVAAIDEKKRIANFSSRGARIDVAAPGSNILSCWPPNTLAKLSGTSMATPFVAGLAALYVAAHKAHGRPVTVDGFRQDLRKTAQDLGPKGFDTGYGWGVVDPAALLPDPAVQSLSLTLVPEDLSEKGLAKLQEAGYPDPWQILSIQPPHIADPPA